MKLTEQQINIMFEKWFNGYMPECDVKLAFNESKEAFKAAISLLLPVIEKLQESNDYYADKINWEKIHDTRDSVIINEEDWSEAESMVSNCIRGNSHGGKLARQTKQQVEQMIKELGGKNE